MSNYKILTLSDHIIWNEYIHNLPLDQQDIYYTPEYYSLYENNGDGKALCFVFEKDDDFALYPFLINSVNNIGYDLDNQYYDIQGAYGYNGVVYTTNNLSFRKSFNEAFYDYISINNIISEFTRFHPLINNCSFPIEMKIIKDRNTVYLDLSKSYDEIWEKQYSSINRNMIRKALKHGIIIEASSLESDYDVFYELYKITMQNIGADEYYHFSPQYFKVIKEQMVNNHILLLAKKNNKIICGTIIFINKYYCHYHLSGRLREFANTGVNNLILDEAIKIAKNLGCHYFHFGGGATGLENDSLLKFKSNFSKSFSEFYIGKKIHNQSIYDEVIEQWERKHPEKNTKFNNYILKYRY